MKVALVIQRYGAHVLGGAEQGCRQLAEALSTRDDLDVEVLSTTAKESTTWADEFPTGTTVENGVRVRRFRTVQERSSRFPVLGDRLCSRPDQVTPEEMDLWVEYQGPVTPGLVEHLETHGAEYDVVVFYTYLYWPAIRGIPVLRERCILMPAAHDEPPIYLPAFKMVFETAGGLVFQTEEERALVHRLFDVGDKPEAVTGLGVVEGHGDPDRFRSRTGIDGPFLLYIGRMYEGKGVRALYDYFRAYKDRRPGSDLKLVLVGPPDIELEPHPDVVVLGPVSDADKWDAISACTVLVNPSPYESFSIVIMEAWYAARPVLVYAGCGPTQGHASRSNGGLWFLRYGDFEAVVDHLIDDPGVADSLGRQGERYVRANYTWPIVRDRYAAFLQEFVASLDARESAAAPGS